MQVGRLARAILVGLTLSGCDAFGPGQQRVTSVDREALARGRQLFVEHCAICHGDRGDGLGPRHASLSRRPPDLRSPLFRASAERERVRRAIRDGVPGSDMPPWLRLGEPAVDDLTAYVLSLGPSSQGGADSHR